MPCLWEQIVSSQVHFEVDPVVRPRTLAAEIYLTAGFEPILPNFELKSKHNNSAKFPLYLRIGPQTNASPMLGHKTITTKSWFCFVFSLVAI